MVLAICWLFASFIPAALAAYLVWRSAQRREPWLPAIGTVLLGALFGFVAFKVGVSMDASAATGGITLLVAIAAFRIGQQLDPVYQNWKSVRAKTTAHIFTADGVELASANGPTLLRWTSISKVVETKKGFLFYRDGKLATFLPARNLEGPAEAELIRKFIRKMVADATLRG